MFFGGHLKSLSLDKTRLTASESIVVTPVLGVSALPFGTSSVTADRLGGHYGHSVWQPEFRDPWTGSALLCCRLCLARLGTTRLGPNQTDSMLIVTSPPRYAGNSPAP